jgi:hypothetical protein
MKKLFVSFFILSLFIGCEIPVDPKSPEIKSELPELLPDGKEFSVTKLNTPGAPEIIAKSSVWLNGEPFVFSEQTKVSGEPESGKVNYIYAKPLPAESDVLAFYSCEEPTVYNEGCWYNKSGHAAMAKLFFVKNGSNSYYNGKVVLDNIDALDEVNTLQSMDGGGDGLLVAAAEGVNNENKNYVIQPGAYRFVIRGGTGGNGGNDGNNNEDGWGGYGGGNGGQLITPRIIFTTSVLAKLSAGGGGGHGENGEHTSKSGTGNSSGGGGGGGRASYIKINDKGVYNGIILVAIGGAGGDGENSGYGSGFGDCWGGSGGAGYGSGYARRNRHWTAGTGGGLYNIDYENVCVRNDADTTNTGRDTIGVHGTYGVRDKDKAGRNGAGGAGVAANNFCTGGGGGEGDYEGSHELAGGNGGGLYSPVGSFSAAGYAQIYKLW